MLQINIVSTVTVTVGPGWVRQGKHSPWAQNLSGAEGLAAAMTQTSMQCFHEKSKLPTMNQMSSFSLEIAPDRARVTAKSAPLYVTFLPSLWVFLLAFILIFRKYCYTEMHCTAMTGFCHVPPKFYAREQGLVLLTVDQALPLTLADCTKQSSGTFGGSRGSRSTS